MAFALVASASVAGTGGGTTPAIDTTGASLLVVAVSWYSGIGGISAVTVGDSNGNTWTPLTLRSSGDASFRLFYKNSAAVGAGHTVIVGGGTQYSVSTFWAFSGSGTFGVESGATTAAAGPLASGSVTPSANGALILTGWSGMNTPSSPSVSGGFALTTSIADASGINLDGAHGYLVQTTAAAINPTWSWTGTGQVAVGTAVFVPAVVVTKERTYLSVGLG